MLVREYPEFDRDRPGKGCNVIEWVQERHNRADTKASSGDDHGRWILRKFAETATVTRPDLACLSDFRWESSRAGFCARQHAERNAEREAVKPALA